MDSKICSKLWTDLALRFQERKIGSCCKSSTMYSPSLEELRRLKGQIFLQNPLLLADKKIMVEKNELPGGCNVCVADWPNSHWHETNLWKNNLWDSQTLKQLVAEDQVYQVELYLSNTCNLSCMYCGSYYSSTWAQISKDTAEVKKQCPDWDEALIEAFSEYAGQINRRLKIVFLGGEPLLDPRCLDLVEMVAMNRIHMGPFATTIAFSTNLNVPSTVIERVISIVNRYRHVGWSVNPSVDGVGKEADEIRDGFNSSLFEANVDRLLEERVNVCLAPAMSCLNVANFVEFIEWFLAKAESFNIVPLKVDGQLTLASMNVVRSPLAMHPGLLPASYKLVIETAHDILQTRVPQSVMRDDYLTGLKRLADLIGSKRQSAILHKTRRWFVEQGELKNKNYFKIFPILNEIFLEEPLELTK